jgi:serine/threonine-protein kinase
LGWLVLLAVVAGGGYWGYQHQREALDRIRPLLPNVGAAQADLLVVDSEPSGAQVKVSGSPIGTTPLAVDNRYPEGTIPIEISRAGYRTWKGTFQGGGPAVVRATLRRR